MTTPEPSPLQAHRSLAAGIVALRWAAYGWMVAGNVFEGELRRPLLGAILIAAAGAWTAFVSVTRDRPARWIAWVDLGIAVALILMSGVVGPERSVMGDRLFFAATYPIGVALAWGVASGPWGGLAATAVLGAGLVASRPINGFSLSDLSGSDYGLIVNGMVAYLLAAIAGGVTSRVLDRWAHEHQLLQQANVRAHERAARYAEREKLARQIHDSVLQALALVDKRGTELAAAPEPDPTEIAELARIARQQEQQLRSLILRQPDDLPTGAASLRDELESVARSMPELSVTVSSVGSIVLPSHVVDEMAAATRQALANVREHADATRVTVFADDDGAEVTVTIRDDGRGFTLDEAALEAAGKVGILRSIKGRVLDLGGTFELTSAAGAGTEVTLRVPRPAAD